jgi:hypothetical protein
MGAYSRAIFIGQSNVVGANRDEPAIGNLEFAMELGNAFSLPAVLGAEASAAEHKDHWMLPLQFGELPALCRVVGQFIIGKERAWNNVRSHVMNPRDLDAFREIRTRDSFSVIYLVPLSRTSGPRRRAPQCFRAKWVLD